MFKVAPRIVIVLAIVVGCVGLDPACFPGCKYTKQWTDCVPFRKSHGLGLRKQGTCVLCPAELQEQPARVVKNSSQPTALCLPDEMNVAVRGFTFGVLSIQKVRLPPSLKTKTHILALVECGITDLEQETLAAFPVLNLLQLDSNHLMHVNRTWFDGLKSPFLMWTLSLSHNNISSMDSACFQRLTALSTLLLDDNSLQTVESSWFHNLKSVAQLSLRSNSIKSIHPQAFKSLKRLRRLDLSRNALTCVSWETMNGLHRLEKLAVGGNRLLSLDNSAPLAMNWRLDYSISRFTGQRVAVRVNQLLFCITKGPKLTQYHVHTHYNASHLVQLGWDHSYTYLCGALKRKLTATVLIKYDLPFVVMSVNTETDKHASNITHLCTQAWEDSGVVKVALGGDTTLQIVPMGVDKSSQPQTVAVVVSDIMADGKNRSMSCVDGRNVSTFGHEERMNVTCHIDTWGETYRHVFTPSDGTEKMTQATTKPVTMTTYVVMNQTSLTANGTVTARPGKERCACMHVGIITVLAVVGVELVALLVACIIRKQRCWLKRAGNPSPPAVVSMNRWIIGGVGGEAVSVNVSHPSATDNVSRPSATDAATQTAESDLHQYSEIPDEYYNYYNTRPGAQHPYWEIPDEYYTDYINTRPQSYPDEVTFYAAVAEVALPSQNRQGGKHPSYNTVSRTRSLPQIHARQRKANIRSYGRSVAGRHRVRDIVFTGRYDRTRGPLMSRAGLYNNPSAHPALASRQRTNVKYQTAHKRKPSRTRQNMAYLHVQAPHNTASHRRQSI